VEVGAQLVLIGFHLRSERKRECVWNEIFLFFYFLFGGIDFYVVKERNKTKELLCVLSRRIGFCDFFIFYFLFF
jgi:hypothetical protein